MKCAVEPSHMQDSTQMPSVAVKAWQQYLQGTVIKNNGEWRQKASLSVPCKRSVTVRDYNMYLAKEALERLKIC